jgi:hypothetical protein
MSKKYKKLDPFGYSDLAVKKAMVKAVNWLNNNQEKIAKKVLDGEMSYKRIDDLWGMPKSLIKRLNAVEIKYIKNQMESAGWFIKEACEFQEKEEIVKYPVVFEWNEAAPVSKIHRSLSYYSYPIFCRPYYYKGEIFTNTPSFVLVLADGKINAIRKLKNHYGKNKKFTEENLEGC